MKVHRDDQYPPPHGNTVIWRYIGLEKFMDLLLNERLHFSNVGRTTDQYEATIPRRNVEAYRRMVERSGLSGKDLEEAVAMYGWEINALRLGAQLNCWSIGPTESYALWRIYLSSSRGGVAIRSTVSRLTKSIEQGQDPYPDHLYIGQVRYGDFIPKEQLNRGSVLLTKTHFYTFENELRLFILEVPRSEGGLERPYDVSVGRTVRVDLDLMVQQIYLSPFAGPWFEPTFRAMVERLRPSLAPRVVASEIRDA